MQVYTDYLSQVAWKVNQEAALELAALHTCREYIEKQSFVHPSTHTRAKKNEKPRKRSKLVGALLSE